VVIENVPEVWPAGMTVVLGTTAEVDVLESETVTPPEPAGPLSVTVPVEAFPPVTLDGLNVSKFIERGRTVIVAFWFVPAKVAVIVGVALVVTVVVAILKLAEPYPAGTTTLDGTVAAELFDARLTVVPPDGASPFRVTVPVDGNPPTTVLGAMVSEERGAGVTVSVAL